VEEHPDACDLHGHLVWEVYFIYEGLTFFVDRGNTARPMRTIQLQGMDHTLEPDDKEGGGVARAHPYQARLQNLGAPVRITKWGSNFCSDSVINK
jgi:hypothetical protein